MKYTRYLLPVLFLAATSCQTFTFGLNPEPDAQQLLDALENADEAAIKNLITEDSAETLDGLSPTLKMIRNKDSKAAAEARKSIREYKVEKCYVGSGESFCKLSNGSEIVLEGGGFSWKVNLKRSSFVARFREEMGGLFRSELPPEQVAIRFTRALMKGDVEEAKKLSTDQSQMIVQLIAGMMSGALEAQSDAEKAEMQEKMKELDSMECDVQGDEASCGPQGKEKKLGLIRESGVWKVHFQKPAQEEEEDKEEEMTPEEKE